MAACGSLEHNIFEKPLPGKSYLLDSLSPWKQIESMKSVDHSSFSEIFGIFKENNVHDHHYSDFSSSWSSSVFSSPSSSLSSNSFFTPHPNASPFSPLDIKRDENGISGFHQDKNGSPKSSYRERKQYRQSDSFSSNSESLSICTEGLGFESFDDVEDLLRNDIFCNNNINNNNDYWQFDHDEEEIKEPVITKKIENDNLENNWCEISQKSTLARTTTLPPPISSIGWSGKPCVSFKSFRQDGRFILKEIRIPNKELLHACREDGRLKLQFTESEDEDEDKELHFLEEVFEGNDEDTGINNVEMQEEM